MRILFLTCHLPFPPLSGGRRREYELLTRLSKKHEIHLYCICKTYDDDRANGDYVRPYCADLVLFPAADPLAQREVSQQLSFAHCPPQVLRHRSQAAAPAIARALQAHHFDLVHVEGYYLMQHLPLVSPAPLLLVEQNIEYLLYQQRLAVADTPQDRERLRDAYLRTLAWERAAWRRADLCAVVTRDDQRALRAVEPALRVRLVPDGFDHDTRVLGAGSGEGAHQPTMAHRVECPTILYVGNFAYEPNVDAALHLAQDIFPLIQRAVPEVTLLLVGNAPPPVIQTLATLPRILVTGLVPSLEPYFAAADVVACPLRIGGGVKVKILEALARGKAVVTTSIGVQGLEGSSGQAAAVKDDPTEFAAEVVHLLRDPSARRRLEEGARLFVKRLPTWDDAADALTACYQELAPPRHSSGAPSPTPGPRSPLHPVA